MKFKFGREFSPVRNKKFKKQKKVYGEVAKIFEYLPAFGHKLLFDEDGRVWIEQYKRENRFKDVTYDIFSKEGIYIKRVKCPFRIYMFKNKKIYGILCKEEGEQRLIKCARIVAASDSS